MFTLLFVVLHFPINKYVIESFEAKSYECLQNICCYANLTKLYRNKLKKTVCILSPYPVSNRS